LEPQINPFTEILYEKRQAYEDAINKLKDLEKGKDITEKKRIKETPQYKAALALREEKNAQFIEQLNKAKKLINLIHTSRRNKKMEHLSDKLRVGIIQTNIDIKTSWHQDGELIQSMNFESQNMALDEIRRGFKEFNSRGKSAPRIVLVPEYSIPHFAIHHVEKMAREIDAVLIGGCDLFVENGNASNRGIIVVPNKWPAMEPAYRSTSKYMGKQYFSKPEFEWFNAIHVSPMSDETHYIIDAGPYGKIGVAICADFYDIERFVIYKGRIHHLIIIA